MNVAQVIVHSLEKFGVKRVYGIIGTTILDLLDALKDSKIRYISTRHEQVAASMADAEGRLTGRPGVAFVHGGPGFLNCLISVADAYKDCSPLLLLAGAVKRRMSGLDSWLEVNQREMVRSIVKGCYRIDRPAEAGKTVSEAYSLAMSPPFGPVFIEVPEDVCRLEAELQDISPEPRSTPQFTSEDVAKVAELLRGSNSPLILVGGGLNNKKGAKLLASFVEKNQIPVISTGNGRGAVPEDHPLSLGRVGFGGGNIIADSAFEKADLVIGFGAGFSDVSTYGYNLMPKGNLVAIDLDPIADRKPVPYTLHIQADGMSFLEKLSEQDVSHESNESWFRFMEEKRESWKRLLEDATSRKYDGFVNPSKFFKELDETLPKDAIVTAGQGLHILYAYAFLKIRSPVGFIAATNLGAMGFAFAASLGAKLVEPEREVVAVLGDGEFLMTVQDLETAVREKIAAKIVVVNDNSYRVLYMRQMVQKMGRVFGTLHTNPDTVKLAEAFGIEGVVIDDDSKISSGVDFLMIEDDKPRLLELKVSPDDLPPLNLEASLKF